VQHDHRGGVGVALGVDEVAQQVLEVVHPVQERDVERRPEQLAHAVLGEELVRGHLEQERAAPAQHHVGLERERRIDADRVALELLERLAQPGPDLEVRARAQLGAEQAQERLVLDAAVGEGVLRNLEQLHRAAL
jgi:hypothetical protein